MDRATLVALIRDLSTKITEARTANDADSVASLTDDLSSATTQLRAFDAVEATPVQLETPGTPATETRGVLTTEVREGISAIARGSMEPVLVASHVRDITVHPTAEGSPAYYEVEPMHVGGVGGLPPVGRRLTDVFGLRATNRPQVTRFRQTGFTNNAQFVMKYDPVANTWNKLPKSAITFEKIKADAEWVGHYIATDKETLEDAAELEGIINGTLMRGVFDRLDQVLLADANVANAPASLLTNANIQKLSYSTDDDGELVNSTVFGSLDTVRLAIAAVANTGLNADFILTSPGNLAALEMLKDSDGNYSFDFVQRGGLTTLWGVPVITIAALGNRPTQDVDGDGTGAPTALDPILVGSSQAVEIYGRHAQIRRSENVDDDFLVPGGALRIAGEGQFAVLVTVPEALVLIEGADFAA